MTVTRLIALTAVAASIPFASMAQDAEVNFWLKQNPNNISGCIAFDPQFTREHTFILKDGQASITASGGINTKLALVRPRTGDEDHHDQDAHHQGYEIRTRRVRDGPLARDPSGGERDPSACSTTATPPKYTEASRRGSRGKGVDELRKQ